MKFKPSLGYKAIPTSKTTTQQSSQRRLNSRSVWSQHQKVAGPTQDHEETDSSFPHLCHNWNQSKGGPRSASACGCFSLSLCVVKLWMMNLYCIYNYGLLNMVGRHWLPGKPHSWEKETNPETSGEHSRTKLSWSTQAVEKIPETWGNKNDSFVISWRSVCMYIRTRV